MFLSQLMRMFWSSGVVMVAQAVTILKNAALHLAGVTCAVCELCLGGAATDERAGWRGWFYYIFFNDAPRHRTAPPTALRRCGASPLHDASVQEKKPRPSLPHMPPQAERRPRSPPGASDAPCPPSSSHTRVTLWDCADASMGMSFPHHWDPRLSGRPRWPVPRDPRCCMKALTAQLSWGHL